MTDATWIDHADGTQPLRGYVPRPAAGVDSEAAIRARAKPFFAGDPDFAAAFDAQLEARSWARMVGFLAETLGAPGHG